MSDTDIVEVAGESPLLIPDVSAAERPMKLQRVLSPATLAKWSPNFVRALFGSSPILVEYSLSEIFRPLPELNDGRYFRKVMPFDQALERIAYCDHYAFNHYISSLHVDDLLGEAAAHLPQLRNSVNFPPMNRILFIGNSKSGTHLHYDLPDNVVLVLAGKKQFRFLPPRYLRQLKPHAHRHSCCNYSSLTDGEIRSFIQHQRDPDIFSITADPGEMIYIPSCWWHRVVNEGLTISLSNFWQANGAVRRTWAYRRIRRVAACDTGH